MAIGPVAGKYNQTVPDPDKDQADAKFGGYASTKTIKDSGHHDYNQKSGAVKDSGD